MTKKLYTERRFMRALEKGWISVEGVVNRFAKSDFNPFHHLGTLTIFMLVVLIATGVYLTLFYRPGAEVAYDTVAKISSTWYGSLIRSVHRYASDAMIILIILHLCRMFLGDRFWGPRWLAWTSGWIMLAMVWLTGTFGYWMIWDERAQWMTEFMMKNIAGYSGLTYISTDLASRTFSNFVIILFLHLFVPLVAFFAINIHSLRLSRARWWTPRWAAFQALVGLIILSLIKPAMSYQPADLSRMVESVPVDSLYLILLPLTDMWGNVIFWGLAILLVGSLFFLPWLAPGRDDGPAIVTDAKCTGCTLCYTDCPYDAIRMVERNDDSGYPKLAVVNASQCTACGICVGACPVDALDLKGGYNGEQVFGVVKGAVKREVKEGHPVTVLFASQRIQTLGGLPAKLNVNEEKAAVGVTDWGSKDAARVVTAVLPSIGAVNIDWVKTLQNEGVRDLVLLSSPYYDNVNREDAYSILNRLYTRPALVGEGLHWLEATPTDPKPVEKLLDNLHSEAGQKNKPQPILPEIKQRNKLVPSFIGGLFGTVLLLGLFALALPLDVRSGMAAADESALRIAVDAKGKVELAEIPEGITLPEGADPEKIFGGTHYPMSVRVVIDGETVFEDVFKPTGVSGNGRIAALKFLEVESGVHIVELFIKDDSDDFRLAFSGEVNFEKGQVSILAYDEKTDTFVLR
ncbi:MAG TPA: 4Fe-4S binding protein [Anaerolineales bacterium]|nr:4Fe-4S binding protein [Anaerolineales bacterium]HMS00626.1 4Fe-4S binding protein [Anaerolineales bacterium]HNQ93637.1 4Fe-4S binding protein [Anaerolineales bacterium]HNS60018.1 4Fe-4S binding protein [Anaerolineales bacterium]